MAMGILKSLLNRFFGPPGRDRFAKIMADALRRCGESNAYVYDRAGFRLVYTEDGKEKRVVNLVNLHLEYCAAARSQRQDWLLRTCRAMVNPMEIPREFEDVKPDLLPTVRPRSLVESMRLKSLLDGGQPAEMAAAPLTDHLVICLVYDLPNSMQFVMADQVEEWGVSLYEALEVARQNLDEREFAVMALGERLYIIETGDSYDATRLLLKDKVRQLKITGRPVAIPVTRNTLLISGSEDEEGIGIMVTLAEKKAEEARPLCPIPVMLVDDEWETWDVPAAHPFRDRLRQLEMRYLGGEYAEQKEQLEKRNEQTGTDVFVASYSAVEREGATVTWAIWSKGVPTWLPRTDYVALFDPETKWTRFARWDRLQTVVGERMAAQDCYPPRWFVDEFPSPAEIEAIGVEDWGKKE